MACRRTAAGAAKRGARGVIGLGRARAILLVAGASYWIGTRSATRERRLRRRTVRSAEPTRASARSCGPPPQPKCAGAESPKSSRHRRPTRRGPCPEREVATPRAVGEALAPSDEDAAAAAAPAQVAPARSRSTPAPAAASARPTPLSRGRRGSSPEPPAGWSRSAPSVVPGQARLVGNGPRLSRARRICPRSSGRAAIRRAGLLSFQIGTTSQAHSEVLCQRMERIH